MKREWIALTINAISCTANVYYIVHFNPGWLRLINLLAIAVNGSITLAYAVATGVLVAQEIAEERKHWSTY